MATCGSCLRFRLFQDENAWLGKCPSQNRKVSMPDPSCQAYIDEKLLNVFERLFVNRVDTYAIQREDGQYIRVEKALTRETLKHHLYGEVTIGAYQTNPSDNTVKWLCFDVDPEHIKEPKRVALTLYNECTSRFHKLGVLLEASRYPDPSFHVWVLFEPGIPAKAARWLGRKILEYVGVVVELFPKQEGVGPGDFGNLVKLPLGLHRKERKWSWFLDPTTLKSLPKSCLHDAEGCTFSERDMQHIMEFADKEPSRVQLRLSTASHPYGRRHKVRPCFIEALNNHELPHEMRLAVAVEYLAAGYNTEHTTALFKDQQDFDEKKTRYHVEHAQKRGYRPRKCTTIQRLGFCIGDACPIFRRRKRKFEKEVVLL